MISTNNIKEKNRRSFFLKAAAIAVSAFSIGGFVPRLFGKNHKKHSNVNSNKQTTNTIWPSIHPLAVPRSKKIMK
jgi:hypothetical protein